MNCEACGKRLPLLLYGELSFDEEEALEEHLGACESCRAEWARLQTIHAVLDRHEMPADAALLAACRRGLRQSVAALAEIEQVRKRNPLSRLRDLFASPLGAWMKPVGALALLALGFAGGRLLPPGRAPLPAIGLTEPVISRVRSLEPDGAGRVQMVVEETRQRRLNGSIHDDRIRGLLLAASRDAADPGVRVDSVDLLTSRAESDEVRRALLHALQHDANPGVRLKALDGLRHSAADPETRRALARVVLADSNSGVRTQAIDLLTSSPQPDVAGVLQELMQREQNAYLRMKVQKVLHEMKASVDTF
ncbi:MAG: HEAT repeat domain-containing protein [Acidobacteria bacterium]|nr:HEAT repeat domain-containing protein [Acidobacteriota bacterium]